MKNWMIAILLMTALSNAQEWNADLSGALTEAAKRDKNVLLYFSAAEACDICIQLEQTVFSSAVFKEYARANYILAKPEFDETIPIQEKADNLLIVEKYNKDGFFPLVVILDPSGKVLGKTGVYNGESPDEYLRILKGFDR